MHLIVRAVAALTVFSLMMVGCARAAREGSAIEHTTLADRFLAGWNLTTPALVRSASDSGITVAMLYGPAPEPASPLGEALTRAHMHVITAEVADRVSEYECARTYTVALPPVGAKGYCPDDTHYRVEQLISDVGEIARRDSSNSLVIGHWILDDVAGWDGGGLRSVLPRIRSLLPRSQMTVCGFSASIGGGASGDWDPRRAKNFTSEACDMVAPYVYSSPAIPGSRRVPIDWSMSTVLPEMLRSLRSMGWTQHRTAILGIGQAWGGRHSPDGAEVRAPTADEVVSQAKAFLDVGATSIGWYAWQLSKYPDALTPANDREIGAGVKRVSQFMAGVWKPGA